mmetsp:Transcript_19178/g.43663  ORF Transcript_19178/g.43663 Transcript_19178/m.43663 type:complete len:439 (-) Transcript_19178:383-1699(-)
MNHILVHEVGDVQSGAHASLQRRHDVEGRRRDGISVIFPFQLKHLELVSAEQLRQIGHGQVVEGRHFIRANGGVEPQIAAQLPERSVVGHFGDELAHLQVVGRLAGVLRRARGSPGRSVVVGHGGTDELRTGVGKEILVPLVPGVDLGEGFPVSVPDLGAHLLRDAGRASGTDVGEDGEERDHPFVEFGQLFGSDETAEGAVFEAPEEEGGHGRHDAGGVAVTAEEEVGDARVISDGGAGGNDAVEGIREGSFGRHRRPARRILQGQRRRMNDGVHDVAEGFQSRETAGVISQQTLETAEADGGVRSEDSMALGGGGGVLFAVQSGDADQTVEVKHDRLHRPRVAIFAENLHLVFLTSDYVGAELTERLELVHELVHGREGPFGRYVETAHRVGAGIVREVQQSVEQVAVRAPAVDTVRDGRATRPVIVTGRQFAVQS